MTSVVDDSPLRPVADHAPWCTDHQTDLDDPDSLEMSWCRGDKRTIGGIETSLTEALDGTVEIYVQDNGADSMSLESVRSLRARLEDLERQATPVDRATLNTLAMLAEAAGFPVTEETWAGIRTQTDAHGMSRAIGEWISAASASTPVTAGDDRMLSVPEAAEMLNARRYPVGMMCRSGELPGVKISGRWAIPRSAVLQFIADVAERRSDEETA